MDDYDTILYFITSFVTLHGFGNRLALFLSTQHMEYKLYFENLLVLAEYGLTGRVNFIFLEQLGNLFPLLTTGLLWLLFRPRCEQLADKLLLFSPVVFLLFAPMYMETLDWAMGSLQNLTVIFFVVLALYLLNLEQRGWFIVACISLIFAIGSSGNGFFLTLVGVPLLLQRRHRLRAGLWALVAVAMAIIYAYHYTFVHITPSPLVHHRALDIVLFPLVFIGSASCMSILAIPASIAILGAIALLVFRKWRHNDPVTFYIAAFILITASAVGVTRHHTGIAGALSSRYRIYSHLLLVILYMASLCLDIAHAWKPVYRQAAIVSLSLILAMFCLRSDIEAEQQLHRRTELVRSHYAGWIRDPDKVSLVPVEDLGPDKMDAFRRQAVWLLRQAVKLGTYKPPDEPIAKAGH